MEISEKSGLLCVSAASYCSCSGQDSGDRIVVNFCSQVGPNQLVARFTEPGDNTAGVTFCRPGSYQSFDQNEGQVLRSAPPESV